MFKTILHRNGINKDLINEWMNHFSSSLTNEKLAGCREQIYTIKQTRYYYLIIKLCSKFKCKSFRCFVKLTWPSMNFERIVGTDILKYLLHVFNLNWRLFLLLFFFTIEFMLTINHHMIKTYFIIVLYN